MMPTFAEVAGASVDAETDGNSMLPALFGETEKRDGHLLWEFPATVVSRLSARASGRRSGSRSRKTPTLRSCCFDLSVDRNEKNNVAVQHPKIVEQLKKIMFSDRSPSVLPSWEAWVQKGRLD